MGLLWRTELGRNGHPQHGLLGGPNNEEGRDHRGPLISSWELKMISAKSVGRLIGVLLCIQLTGLIVPFVLLHPLTTGPRDFLANAAGASLQIKVAVFLLFANCALTIGIAIAAWPVFRQYSEAMALWLVAVGVIMF